MLSASYYSSTKINPQPLTNHPQGLHRWFYYLVQAGYRHLPDGLFANYHSCGGANGVQGEHAARPGAYNLIERDTAYLRAVRAGHIYPLQYYERCVCYTAGSKYLKNCHGGGN